MLFPDLLTRRVRADGARPLLTWYAADGQRTELSAVSYENWVAKTANLLLGTLGLGPGDTVALPLARTHPGHWMTLVWIGAVWRAGLLADVRPGTVGAVDVVGPELDLTEAADHLACSLHPFGLGFGTALPGGVTDWAAEVKIEPDAYLGGPVDADDLAWVDAERRLTQAELVIQPAAAERVLLRPTDPWVAVRDGLLAPLLGSGSAVLTDLPPERTEELARLAEAERAVLR